MKLCNKYFWVPDTPVEEAQDTKHINKQGNTDKHINKQGCYKYR